MTEIREKDIKQFHNGQCIFDDINLCQKPGSGGHPGTIMSVDKFFCAKKVEMSDENLELRFINNDFNQEFFKGFIPKFRGMCDLNDKKYIMIENLKYDFEEPIVLDIKIGFKTANKELLDLINYKKNKKYKLFKQDFIDNHSTTSKYGYRAEGFEGDNKVSKGKLKSMKPENTFDMYFKKDHNNLALKDILQKLRNLYDLIMKPEFDTFVLTGSSLLFIYDAKDQSKNSVKMIDFSNSYVYTPQTLSQYNAGFVESYRKGIRSLIGDLIIFLGNKEFKKDKGVPVMRQLVRSVKIAKDLSRKSINNKSRMSQKVKSQALSKNLKSMKRGSSHKNVKEMIPLSSKKISKKL